MRPGARVPQHLAAIEAAVKAGVGHITFVSTLGTRATHLQSIWAAYFEPEQALMRIAKSWTIPRMSLYAEVLIDEAKQSLSKGVHAVTSHGRVSYV
jgi:NAD(P)H dehydrogenase (quinone)